MNPRIKQVNQMFLITVLVSLAASMMPIDRLFPTYAMRILFSEIILAAPGAVYLLAGRQNYAKAVRLKPIRLGTFFWLILFTACIMPVMSLVNAISMLFVENTTTSMMANVTGGNSYLFSMLLIALLPCVFEESVYRGLFYNEYRKAAPLAGMLLSAFLFGIMHGNLNQFSYAFLMGIIFALIIEATDSILSSMIMHFIINGFSVTVMALYPKLIAYLARMQEEAAQSGNTELAEQLSSFADLNPEGLIDMELAGGTDTLAGIIRSFLPAALIGGIVAVIVYRVIAAGEGRLEHVNSLFRRANVEKAVENYGWKGAEIGEEESLSAEVEENSKMDSLSARIGENGKEENLLMGMEEKEESLLEKMEVNNKKRTLGTWKRLITIPLLVGMAICFSLMIVNELI